MATNTGRPRFFLESWKFAVYISLPIICSLYYDNPERQKKAADYWGYVKYPANPASMKEQIEQAAATQKQRQAYREQLQELNRSANRRIDEHQQEEEEPEKKAWLRWIDGLRRGKSNSEDGDATAHASSKQ